MLARWLGRCQYRTRPGRAPPARDPRPDPRQPPQLPIRTDRARDEHDQRNPIRGIIKWPRTRLAREACRGDPESRGSPRHATTHRGNPQTRESKADRIAHEPAKEPATGSTPRPSQQAKRNRQPDDSLPTSCDHNSPKALPPHGTTLLVDQAVVLDRVRRALPGGRATRLRRFIRARRYSGARTVRSFRSPDPCY